VKALNMCILLLSDYSEEGLKLRDKRMGEMFEAMDAVLLQSKKFLDEAQTTHSSTSASYFNKIVARGELPLEEMLIASVRSYLLVWTRQIISHYGCL